MTTSTDCIEQIFQDARELQASAVERLDQGPSGTPRAWPGRARRPKLKPRWDVHSRGDEDWLGCASGALSSVLGE